MFKVDAREWMDHVGKLGRDAIIAESLDAASRGSGEDKGHPPHHPGPLPHADSGPGQRRHRLARRDRHQGPRRCARRRVERERVRRLHRRRRVIAKALRGYLSDDVWGVGRPAASGWQAAPVLSKNRDRIVGAAVRRRGDRAGAGGAAAKKNLDVDVALLLRGKVIASSRAAGRAGRAARADRASTRRRSRASKRTPAAAADGRAGQAARRRGAVPRPGRRAAGATTRCSAMQPAKQRTSRRCSPTSTLRRSQVGATSPGCRWSWCTFADDRRRPGPAAAWRSRRRCGRLRRELQKLASGDIHKIRRPASYGGKVGGLARDVNAAVERFTHAPGASARRWPART